MGVKCMKVRIFQLRMDLALQVSGATVNAV